MHRLWQSIIFTSPCVVNLMAFPTRLIRTCLIHFGSLSISAGISPPYSTSKSSLLSVARTSIIERISSTKRLGANRSRLSSNLPTSIFDRSRMSLMISISNNPLRRMVRTYSIKNSIANVLLPDPGIPSIKYSRSAVKPPCKISSTARTLVLIWKCGRQSGESINSVAIGREVGHPTVFWN